MAATVVDYSLSEVILYRKSPDTRPLGCKPYADSVSHNTMTGLKVPTFCTHICARPCYDNVRKQVVPFNLNQKPLHAGIGRNMPWPSLYGPRSPLYRHIVSYFFYNTLGTARGIRGLLLRVTAIALYF